MLLGVVAEFAAWPVSGYGPAWRFTRPVPVSAMLGISDQPLKFNGLLSTITESCALLVSGTPSACPVDA